MGWKKILKTKELIAYEKCNDDFKVTIEARNKNNGWLIYKTYNFRNGNEWVSHVREYVSRTKEETKELILELKKEKDLTLKEIIKSKRICLDMKRCYKEDFVEKWKFSVDEPDENNFVIIKYDQEIKMDIVMHDRYNSYEKEIIEKLINALGLKEIAEKIRYDFFYFKKHSAKRRIYNKKDTEGIIAKLELNMGNNIDL